MARAAQGGDGSPALEGFRSSVDVAPGDRGHWWPWKSWGNNWTCWSLRGFPTQTIPWLPLFSPPPVSCQLFLLLFVFYFLKQRKKTQKRQRSCRMGRTEVRGQTCLRALQHFLARSSVGSLWAPFGAPPGPLGQGDGSGSGRWFRIRWIILDQVDGSGSGG